MTKNVEVKTQISYCTHSIKENGIVNLTLKSNYENLTNTMQCMQMLNNDVDVEVKIYDKVIKLGSFRIKNIAIDGDGESKINFISSNEFANLNELNELAIRATKPEAENEFLARITSEIIIEEVKEEPEKER